MHQDINISINIDQSTLPLNIPNNLKFSTKYYMRFPLCLHACYAYRSSHAHLAIITIIKLRIMYFSPLSRYSLPPRSKECLLQILFWESSLKVRFMWQTRFHTQHALTCICRALSVACLSSSESIVGSNHWQKETIDTLPEEKTKLRYIQCVMYLTHS